MIELLGYTKLNRVLSDGTPIYFPNDIKEYRKSIYEVFISKETGRERELVVGHENVKYTPSDDDIEIDGDFVGHKVLSLNTFKFQFNLNKYCCFCDVWDSGFSNVQYLLYNKLNKYPKHVRETHYKINEAINETGYFPLEEICFVAGNGKRIKNYIPDKIFFSYPDKQVALDRITYYSQKAFKGVNYASMNDMEVLGFVNDRLNRRIKLEQIIKRELSFIKTY